MKMKMFEYIKNTEITYIEKACYDLKETELDINNMIDIRVNLILTDRWSENSILMLLNEILENLDDIEDYIVKTKIINMKYDLYGSEDEEEERKEEYDEKFFDIEDMELAETLDKTRKKYLY